MIKKIDTKVDNLLTCNACKIKLSMDVSLIKAFLFVRMRGKRKWYACHTRFFLNYAQKVS